MRIVLLSVLCFCISNLSAENLLTNGGFEMDLLSWFTGAKNGSVADFTVETVDIVEGAKAMKVDITTVGSNPWDVQAIHGGWSCFSGKEYQLTVWAKASVNGKKMRLVQQNSTYSQKELTLSTSYTKYTWTFTAQEDGLQLKLHFPETGVFYFDDFVLIDVAANAGDLTKDTITLDLETTHQEMVGFGGALTWYSERVTNNADKETLYDLIFEDLGMDIVRFKNWYYPANYPTDKSTTNLEVAWMSNSYNATMELYAQAKLHDPDMETLLCSWGPSSHLKSNNDLSGGKLKHNGTRFMYSEYAQYTEDMLDDFSAHGVTFDYLSIQNEAGYVATWETCEWRPSETADFAGYDVALDSVYNRLQNTSHSPKLIGAETENIGWDSDINENTFRGYTTPLKNKDHLSAYAYHLYNYGNASEAEIMNTGTDLNMIRDEFGNKPTFMTEFSKYDWFNTALMIHQNLTEANTSAYIYWELVWDTKDQAMIAIDASGNYSVQPPYYTMQHFAKYIDKGYIRTEVQNVNQNVAVSAYKHPTENKLTYVLINRNTDAVETELGLENYSIENSTILQSVDGNWGQNAGSLTGNAISLPARSITTIEVSFANLVAVDTLALRSEYEAVADVIVDLEDINEGTDLYAITAGNADGFYAVNVNTGEISIQKIIPDVMGTVIEHVLEVSIGSSVYSVTIADAYDYFLRENPHFIVLDEHQDVHVEDGNPYTPYNNLWGDGNAVPNTDYRMATLVHANNPDSSVFIWDVPSEAKVYGGSSVWSYINLMWGNRIGQREGLPGFPIQLAQINSLDIHFDFEHLFGTEGYKIAMNHFLTDEDYIAPFSANDGDFFFVFDQKGTWIPPYPTDIGDTIIDGKTFTRLYKDDTSPYQWRRVIIKDNEKLLSGTLDLASVYQSFISRGYLNDQQYIPNIQVGLEITNGWGALRVNKWDIKLNKPNAGRNWYVAGGAGLDDQSAENGQTPEKPLNSLEYAVKNCWSPGDTIFVMNGVYRNQGFGDYQGDGTGGGTGANNPAFLKFSNTDVQTSEDAWLVITNYPGHNPKIEFDGAGGIVMHHVSYVDISGLEIEGPNQKITKQMALNNRLIHDAYFSGRGITVWGGDATRYPHHIKLHHMKVHDCPNSGLRINDADYCEISHNEVYNCTWWSSNAESAIVLAQSKDFDEKTDIIKMRMTHNLVYNNRNFIPFYAGKQIGSTPNYGTEAQDFIHDGQGVYITRNNPGSNAQSADDYNSGWWYLANNIAYGNGINGLVVHHTDKAIVCNNLVFKNGVTSPVPVAQGGEGRQNAGGLTINSSENVYVYNNISWTRYDDTDYNYQVYGTSSYTASNNIGIDGKSAFSSSEAIFKSTATDSPINLFLDTLHKDFHLHKGSLAVDAGIGFLSTPVADVIPLDDFDGTLRDASPDIGPFEYTGLPTVQTIELQQGWNLISLYVDPVNRLTGTVFKNSETVKTQDVFWSKTQPSYLNSLTEIQAGQGYLVYNSVDETIEVSGDFLIYNSPLTINSAWSIIGCPFQTKTDFSVIYKSSEIQIVKDFEGFWIPEGSNNSITDMEPGKAYFIKGK